MTKIITEVMERDHTGTMPFRLTNGQSTLGLTTSRDKIDELWSLLEYYYVIDETRDRFLLSKGINSKRIRDRVGTSFSSYVTQARNFYSYAQSSDFRSAALLYYYSFLNLAKAKIVIEKPEYIGKQFYHGIQRKHKTGDGLKQTCSAKVSYGPDNIATFSELYKLRFDTSLSTSFNISLSNLLGYCTDVQHEFLQTVGNRPKISPVKYQIAIDTNRRKCWVKLAVYDWGRQAKFKGAYAQFFKEFKQISISNLNRQLSWELPPHSVPWYTFFESNIEYDFLGADGINTFSCANQLNRVLKNLYQAELFEPAGGFQLTAPLRLNIHSPCDELIAIYMIMFHLSEVVRYEPELFETALSNKTKSGWLFKNFIESCPATFLQNMVGWITGHQYFMDRR